MHSITYFSLPYLLSALIILLVSLQVFFKNPRSKTHRAFFYFCLSLTGWIFCYSAVYSSRSGSDANRWARLAFYAVALIPSTNFYFYSTIAGIKNRAWAAAFFALSALFMLAHAATPLVYRGVTEFFWGYYPQAGLLHDFFPIFWVATWTCTIRIVVKRMNDKKKSGDFMAYNQTKYLLFGLVGQGLGAVDFLPSYGVPIYPIGYIVAIYWCVIVAFAVTQYKRLADISFLTRRVLIGSAVLLQMAALYLLVSSLRKLLPAAGPYYIAAVSLLAGLLFAPILRATKNLIDRGFFPEYFKRKEKLVNLNQQILLCKTPSEFNRIILDSIFNSFRITRSYLFVWSEERKSYILQSETEWCTIVQKYKMTELPPHHVIPKYLATNKYLVHDEMRGDLDSAVDQRALSLAMLELGVSLCVPICSNGKISGIFLFGDKESGLPYSKEDVKSLTTLAGHTAIAIDNFNLNKRWSDEAMHAYQVDRLLHTYMGSSIADEVLRRVDQAQHWKRERIHATILMSDLREFTNLSEKFSPEEMVRALNEYFSEMIETIMQHGGTVDKFMGDAILAVFGVPKPLPESERSAALCALDMYECLKHLNQKRAAEGLFTLQMGIGIAAGDVVAGNIGSDKRMEYTVIGDAVNTASRLQAIAAPGQILATNRILDKVSGSFHYRKLPPIPIKGKSQPMDVIEILGLKRSPSETSYSDSSIIDLPLFQKKAQ